MKYIVDVKKLKQYAQENKEVSLLCFADSLCKNLHSFTFVQPQANIEAVDSKTIIDYLNSKTGKNFRHTTPKTKKLIQVRAKEGFIIDDFKKAIDNQCLLWTGDMKQYLRPETLFGTKMESYVNNIIDEVKTEMTDDQMIALMMED